MGSPRAHVVGLVVSLAQLLVASVLAEDWSRFRGPNGAGVSTSRGLPVEFGPAKNVDWAVDVPFGRSSPAFAGDRIFLTAIEGGKLVTLALDRASGKLLWRQALERSEWMEKHFGYLDGDGNGCVTADEWGVLNGELGTDDWGVFAIQPEREQGPPKVLWNYRKNVSYIPSPLVYDDVLYVRTKRKLFSFSEGAGKAGGSPGAPAR
jgi:hypothetical protein